MEKVIKIDGREVKFKASAATIRLYRQNTGRDMLLDINKLQESAGSGNGLSAEALNLFEDIAYTMAKQADDSIPDSADEWLDSFEMFSIYLVLPQIIELWRLNELTTTTPKKKRKGVTDRPLTTGLILLRCTQMGLSMSDLDLLDMGMVYDMLNELENDSAEYDIVATQADFDRF